MLLCARGSHFFDRERALQYGLPFGGNSKLFHALRTWLAGLLMCFLVDAAVTFLLNAVVWLPDARAKCGTMPGPMPVDEFANERSQVAKVRSCHVGALC